MARFDSNIVDGDGGTGGVISPTDSATFSQSEASVPPRGTVSSRLTFNFRHGMHMTGNCV